MRELPRARGPSGKASRVFLGKLFVTKLFLVVDCDTRCSVGCCQPVRALPRWSEGGFSWGELVARQVPNHFLKQDTKSVIIPQKGWHRATRKMRTYKGHGATLTACKGIC